jgi:hypothetical protein
MLRDTIIWHRLRGTLPSVSATSSVNANLSSNWNRKAATRPKQNGCSPALRNYRRCILPIGIGFGVN